MRYLPLVFSLLTSCATQNEKVYIFAPGAYEHTLEVKSGKHEMKFWGVMIVQPNRDKKLIALTPLGTRLFELEIKNKEKKFISIDQALEKRKNFLLTVCTSVDKEFDKRGVLPYPGIETLTGETSFYKYSLHILKKGAVY